MYLIGTIGTVLLLLAGSRIGAQQDGLWVAFRYDEDRVLCYVDRMEDPVLQDYSKPLKPPVARYGAGGYLLPLAADRLRTFRAITRRPGTTPGSRTPVLGQQLTLMLGGGAKITVVVEEYVEQWGSENPIVATGLLARVPPAYLATFSEARSSYFLVAAADRPVSLPIGAVEPIRGTTQVLNQFDGLGQLVLTVAEAGWSVTLFSQQNGSLRPTEVRYHYGE